MGFPVQGGAGGIHLLGQGGVGRGKDSEIVVHQAEDPV